MKLLPPHGTTRTILAFIVSPFLGGFFATTILLALFAPTNFLNAGFMFGILGGIAGFYQAPFIALCSYFLWFKKWATRQHFLLTGSLMGLVFYGIYFGADGTIRELLLSLLIPILTALIFWLIAVRGNPKWLKAPQEGGGV